MSGCIICCVVWCVQDPKPSQEVAKFYDGLAQPDADKREEVMNPLSLPSLSSPSSLPSYSPPSLYAPLSFNYRVPYFTCVTLITG